MFITVEDNAELVFLSDDHAVLGTFRGPDFEAIWDMLDGAHDTDFRCSSSIDETDNERFSAIVDAVAAEWSNSPDDETIVQTQYLGFTCKISQTETGAWLAWVALNGGCRVIDRGDDVRYATERTAKADALRLAFEDAFQTVGTH